MKTSSRIIAAGLIGALVLAFAPKPMALADGAASTRNILLGAGAAAATLIIINHNKKVHQRYAEDAQKQAALAEQANNAQAAAQQYKTAYHHELAVAESLHREVAIQQSQIDKLKAQVAAISPPGSNFVAARPAPPTRTVSVTKPAQVVSFGWGDF